MSYTSRSNIPRQSAARSPAINRILRCSRSGTSSHSYRATRSEKGGFLFGGCGSCRKRALGAVRIPTVIPTASNSHCHQTGKVLGPAPSRLYSAHAGNSAPCTSECTCLGAPACFRMLLRKLNSNTTPNETQFDARIRLSLKHVTTEYSCTGRVLVVRARTPRQREPPARGARGPARRRAYIRYGRRGGTPCSIGYIF